MEEHPDYAAIEAERGAMFVKLEAAQGGCFASEKRYLQCLLTPAADQGGTSLSSFDRSRKPGDERDDWSALLVPADVAGGVRAQYCVHRYDGPQGSGFFLSCRVVWDGQDWHYLEHHGPEKRGEVLDGWYSVSGVRE